jgi:CheY-like chemotaxis protein
MLAGLLAMEDSTRSARRTGSRRSISCAPCAIARPTRLPRLLDLKMPRLSGNEFRRAQLGDPTVANVPVAVMSGAIDLEQRAQALGAVAAVTKPIDVDLLMSVVRTYCA